MMGFEKTVQALIATGRQGMSEEELRAWYVREQSRDWENLVRRDTTDWALCRDCASTFRQATAESTSATQSVKSEASARPNTLNAEHSQPSCDSTSEKVVTIRRYCVAYSADVDIVPTDMKEYGVILMSCGYPAGVKCSNKCVYQNAVQMGVYMSHLLGRRSVHLNPDRTISLADLTQNGASDFTVLKS
jgi:hypothetical protein